MMIGGSSNEALRVVCLGDSLTRDRLKPDHMYILQNRAQNQAAYVRVGASDDFAHDLAGDCLDTVVDQQPDVVVVLTGVSDARVSLSPKMFRTTEARRSFTRQSTIDWFGESLGAIVATLVRRTDSRIALLSLPVLGMDLDVPPILPFGRYSQVIKRTAIAHRVSYLPLYERQVQHMIGTINSRCASPSELPRTSEWSTNAAYHTSHGELIVAGVIEDFVTTHSRDPGRSWR